MEFISVPYIVEQFLFDRLCSQFIATLLKCLDRTHIVNDSQPHANTMTGAQLIHEAVLVFSCSSLGNVTPGTSFNVTGTMLPNCERFSINLSIGTTNRDVALHINPRLPQNYIVRNCKLNNVWGIEEITSALPFRLRRGCTFAIQVLVTESEYLVSVNGHHFASFVHRVPYAKVTCLQVFGDVYDVQVDQLSILQYPDRLTTNHVDGAWNLGSVETCNEDDDWRSNWNGEYSMEMPFYGRLPRLQVGHRLHMFGSVKLLPHSFYLNLQSGHNIWPHPIVALHINPRFTGIGGKHVITRNSWMNGKWDREERSELCTDFMPSRSFHMCIACTDAGYLVYVNDKLIVSYDHRVDMAIVDTVYVQGDIHLARIVLEECADSQNSELPITKKKTHKRK